MDSAHNSVPWLFEHLWQCVVLTMLRSPRGSPRACRTAGLLSGDIKRPFAMGAVDHSQHFTSSHRSVQ